MVAIPTEKAGLTPETQRILAAFASNQRYDATLSPAERRRLHEAAFMPLGLPTSDAIDAADFHLPREERPLSVRLYRPRDAGLSPPPLLVHFHGGGMTVGSLDQYDSMCRRLCERSGAAVLTVYYALAPENPYPAAVEDAWFALGWAFDHGSVLGLDVSRLAVGGDSAGGNLAAVLALMARDAGAPPISFQLLIYPAVGTRGESASMDAYSSGYLFEKAHLETIYQQYLSDPTQIGDWRVSPIQAESFAGLPPAFVLSAECEIMRDDIEDFAQLMKLDGVEVELRRYPGMIHPFLSLAEVIPEGAQAIDDCADRLRRALDRPG